MPVFVRLVQPVICFDIYSVNERYVIQSDKSSYLYITFLATHHRALLSLIHNDGESFRRFQQNIIVSLSVLYSIQSGSGPCETRWSDDWLGNP